jgi:hypothetical protein
LAVSTQCGIPLNQRRSYPSERGLQNVAFKTWPSKRGHQNVATVKVIVANSQPLLPEATTFKQLLTLLLLLIS